MARFEAERNYIEEPVRPGEMPSLIGKPNPEETIGDYDYAARTFPIDPSRKPQLSLYRQQEVSALIERYELEKNGTQVEDELDNMRRRKKKIK